VIDVGKLFGDNTWSTDETVEITLEYQFEQSPNITTGQWVDTAHPNRYQPGFFHNSGIKIENRAEIQIFDTESLLDAISNGHAAIIDGVTKTIVAGDPLIDVNGELTLDHEGVAAGAWRRESVNGLINGIPYRYGPNTLAALSSAQPVDSDRKGTLVVEITKRSIGGGGVVDQYDVKINGQAYVIKGLSAVDEARTDQLILQSHWGSGVKFLSAVVKQK
jgi:hypothetical protein